MSSAMHEWPQRHRITVEHFYRMGDAGLFAPDERVELVDGEIIDMPPIGSRHASALDELASSLGAALGSRALVRQQLPLRLGTHSEPLPDIAVLAPRVDRYRAGHPGPGDALLVVEISMTTLRYDLDVKVPLYARHGVAETWVVDLKNNRLHVFGVQRDGVYTATVTTEFGRRSLERMPDVSVDLTPLS
jgi:Uma2 family endonuclease